MLLTTGTAELILQSFRTFAEEVMSHCI